MKLYGSLTSPYVRKVRIVCREKNLKFDMVVEGPADAAGNVARLNPLRAIPVLERDDGEVYFDSPVICELLDSLNDKPRLYPASGEPRWQALRWHALAQGMKEATVTRLVEGRKPAERQDAAQIAKHEGRIAAAIAYAAERVTPGKFLLGGTDIGIADIALGAALEYIDLRYPHDWRGKHPKLAQWLAPISARPSFAETQPPKS